MKILARTGALEREIGFSPIGRGFISAVAYFSPVHSSGGQFLVFDYVPDGPRRAVITDFNGT